MHLYQQMGNNDKDKQRKYMIHLTYYHNGHKAKLIGNIIDTVSLILLLVKKYKKDELSFHIKIKG